MHNHPHTHIHSLNLITLHVVGWHLTDLKFLQYIGRDQSFVHVDGVLVLLVV